MEMHSGINEVLEKRKPLAETWSSWPRGFKSQSHGALPVDYNLARQIPSNSRNISTNGPQEFGEIHSRNNRSPQKKKKKDLTDCKCALL